MQMTLSVNIGNKKIISKPFDFEAMCIIDDARFGDRAGTLNLCRNVVPYLFDGTEATEEELKKFPPDVMTRLCKKIWEIYVEVLNKSEKNA